MAIGFDSINILSQTFFYFKNENGTFAEFPAWYPNFEELGVWLDSLTLGDFDLDLDLDILVAVGNHVLMYENIRGISSKIPHMW